jgi:hypothetical protein
MPRGTELEEEEEEEEGGGVAFFPLTFGLLWIHRVPGGRVRVPT